MSFKDLNIEEYTSKSIVVNGDTRKYKEDLKKLGGKYNSKLSSGPGWIFPKTSKDDLVSFISKGRRLVSDDEIKLGEQRTKQYNTNTNTNTNKTPSFSPSLDEYGMMVSLINDMSKKMDNMEKALKILMDEEQLSRFKKLNKKVEKKKVVVDDNIEIEMSEEDEKPRRRLLR